MITTKIISANPVNLLELRNVIIDAFRRKSIFVHIDSMSQENDTIHIALKVFAFTKFRTILDKSVKFQEVISRRLAGNAKKPLKVKTSKIAIIKNKKRFLSKYLSLISSKQGRYKNFQNSYVKFPGLISAKYIDASKNFRVKTFLLDVLNSHKIFKSTQSKCIALDILNNNLILDFVKTDKNKVNALKAFAKLNKKYSSRLFIRKSKDLGKDVEIAGWLLAHKHMSPSVFLEILILIFLPIYKRKHGLFLKYLKDLFETIISVEHSLIAGFKFTISGKLSGKSMASTRSLAVGSVASKPINNAIKKGGTNKIGTYGFQLTVNYYKLPVLPYRYLASKNTKSKKIHHHYLNSTMSYDPGLVFTSNKLSVVSQILNSANRGAATNQTRCVLIKKSLNKTISVFKKNFLKAYLSSISYSKRKKYLTLPESKRLVKLNKFIEKLSLTNAIHTKTKEIL